MNIDTRLKLSSLDTVLVGVVESLRELHENEHHSSFMGISTGFSDLDKALQGIAPGELVIVASPPSVGKTSFVLNIAEHVITETKSAVAVFSTEATKREIARRTLASVAQVDSACFSSGCLSDQEWGRLNFALEKLHASHLFIGEKPTLNIDRLCERARRLSKSLGRSMGLVIVDTIQGFATTIDPDARSLELEIMASKLKCLAIELDCAVIATSTLGRSFGSRSDECPGFGSLDDSSRLEREADIVLFLHRQQNDSPDTSDQRIVEIVVGKNRRGGVARAARIVFLDTCYRFENMKPTI